MGFSKYLEEKEVRERFIKRTFEQNKKISDFGEFSDALFNAFDTEKGKRASKFFDEKDVITLFKDNLTREQIEDNIGKEETDKLYGDVRRTEAVVIREVPIGKIIKPKQVYADVVPKKVKVPSYVTKKGVVKKSYSRGYSKWKPVQERFLKVRKMKKISAKQIMYEYNQHFKDSPRSDSSLKTKYWRIT